MRAPCGSTVSSRHRSLGCSALACALLLGCGVDDRALSVGSGSNNGNSGGGTSSGGTAASAAGKASQPEPVEIPVCVYDGDVSNDCATLVNNAGFQKNTMSWTPQDGILGAWEPKDATESDASGSIRVVNLLHGEADGVAAGSATQCIAAEAGRSYDLAGDVFITEDQGVGLEGGPYTGKAGLAVFYFASADCSGNSIGNGDAPLVENAGEWTHNSMSVVAPEQTQSLMVRLNTLMPFRQFKFQALFDNVLVRER